MKRAELADDIIMTFDRALEAAEYGRKRTLAESWAARLGVSPSTLYRERARVCGKAKEVTREKEVDQEYIDLLAQRKIRVGERGMEWREYPTDLAIADLEQEGLIPTGALTVSTANRRLRESGFRLPDPKVRVECDYANQVWQLDFTRSKYFQVAEYDERRGDYLLKGSQRHLSYKENNQKRLLWIVQIKDDYSRLRLAAASAASGESALLGLEVLDWAIRRQDDGHPMRGVPDILKVDQGAFTKAKMVQAALAAFGIEHHRSAPYNKDSQGKIENAMGQLWRRFELQLVSRFGEDLSIHLADYNALLHEHLLEEAHERRHPVYKENSRERLYRISLRSRGIREVSESILRHACRVVTRAIDDAQRVQLESHYYAAPRRVDGQALVPGTRIRVHRNAEGEAMGELIDRHAPAFRLEPWAPARYGDFHNRPEQTYRQHQAALVKAGRTGDLSDAPIPEPQATPVDPSSPFADVPERGPDILSKIQARARIGFALQDWGYAGYAALAPQLDPHLREEMTEDQVDQLIAQLEPVLNTHEPALGRTG